jgi:predicted ATP-dependent serine protease
MNLRCKELQFDGEWREVFGCPELAGCWFVMGPTASGKTSFIMQLVKYLTKFERVLINSLEEGASKSMKIAFERVAMAEAGTRVTTVKEDYADMVARLKKHKSANIVVIDSVQYFDMNKAQFKQLLRTFPAKLFVFVSHVKGKEADGMVAQHIRRLSPIKVYTEGYRAFVSSRFNTTGKQEYTIWAPGAQAYWFND